MGRYRPPPQSKACDPVMHVLHALQCCSGVITAAPESLATLHNFLHVPRVALRSTGVKCCRICCSTRSGSVSNGKGSRACSCKGSMVHADEVVSCLMKQELQRDCFFVLLDR